VPGQLLVKCYALARNIDIKNNTHPIRTLTGVRDTLLPKVMRKTTLDKTYCCFMAYGKSLEF